MAIRHASRVTAAVAALVMVLVPVAWASSSGASPATVPNPTVSGPITGGIHGHAFGQYPYDLAAHGYMEQEYFLAGTAYSDGFRGPNEMSNGPLKGYAPYVTRILVTRPIDPRKFNGTAVVEWTNTSAGLDQFVEWNWAHPALMRRGYAYVAVSAQSDWQVSQSVGSQQVAVDGLGPFALKHWDPVRYAPLSHPGDEFARTIFSQAVQAIRHPVGIDPLGGLRPRQALAVGQSQSADRLGTYVERDQASARLINGFLIDDDQRSTIAGGYSQATGAVSTFPIKNPGAVPILNFRSEAFLPGSAPTSSANYRRWEVAGTSHIDYWSTTWQVLGQNFALDTPRGSAADEARAEDKAGDYGERVDPASMGCFAGPVVGLPAPRGGEQFPRHDALQAAIVALDTWVRTGTPAPSAPPIETTVGPTGQPDWARDGNHNAIGGYRLPPIDVPVASYIGDVCSLLGVTIPFDTGRLTQLYPSHKGYVQKMQLATDSAVARGWLLPEDGQDLMRRATTSLIPLPTPVSPLVP